MTTRIYYNGSYLPDIRAIQSGNIDIKRIAQSLQNINRFVGSTEERTYTVLQHCYAVGMLLGEDGYNSETILWGLIHDIDEAFTGDIPKPVKGFFQESLDQIREPIFKAAKEKFGLVNRSIDYEAVHEADSKIGCAEVELLNPFYKMAKSKKAPFYVLEIVKRTFHVSIYHYLDYFTGVLNELSESTRTSVTT